MPSPILARADALMQRRHLSTPDSEEVPVLTDAVDADDEIPVLLDIDSLAAPAAEAAPETDTALIEALSRRIEQRLQAEIPKIVAACVAELIEERQAATPQDTD